MKPILVRFLKIKNSDLLNILRGYIKMRKMFIDYGVTDSQLQRGEGMTRNMYDLRENIIYDLKKIKMDARRFGVIEGNNFEIDDYFSDLFLRVDKKTPL